MSLVRVLHKFVLNKNALRQTKSVRRCFCTRSADAGGDTDVRQSLFFDEGVQDLLKRLTRPEVDKIFRRRKDGSKLEAPSYVFMTDKDLEKAREEARQRAERKLQMPPVLAPRSEEVKVLDQDPRLNKYSDAKFVFTDISFGINDRARTVVVREPDGTLRRAVGPEKSRMNELYFPRPGRKYLPPSMFTGKLLQDLLDREEYEYVLDRACVQFEPDDPLYVRVCSAVHAAVDAGGHFQVLRSTRHYGPLVFGLVARRSVDNLLLENLRTDRLEDAVWLISLYRTVNPGAGSKTAPVPGQELEFVEAFIELDSKKKDVLRLAFNAYKDHLAKVEPEGAQAEM